MTRLPVPVVVVGNLTVGGSGKTPLVIWLARFLREQGWRPGIVTRGYGGRAARWPQTVTPESDPESVGDEPVLLAREAGCPVVADPDRVRAAERLVRLGCNIVVSDDGLQHYRLARDFEIAVIDGARRFGNGRCLPAGPLREPVSRLNEVQARVTLGEAQTGSGRWRWRRKVFIAWRRPRRRPRPTVFRASRCTPWPASVIRRVSSTSCGAWVSTSCRIRFPTITVSTSATSPLATPTRPS